MSVDPGIDVSVGEITVRVADVAAERAAVLGEHVARLIGQALAARDTPVDLGALDLRVSLAPNDASPERIAAAVMGAIERLGA